jgi:hypothetical protein
VLYRVCEAGAFASTTFVPIANTGAMPIATTQEAPTSAAVDTSDPASTRNKMPTAPAAAINAPKPIA